jgi:hypothetical protein
VVGRSAHHADVAVGQHVLAVCGPRRRPSSLQGCHLPRAATLGTLPPQEAWAPGMAKTLHDLRREIENDGWVAAGRGAEPWAFKYEGSASG